MQIKAGNNGHGRAYQLPNARDQFTFAVIGIFCHSSTVQIQIHTVQALGQSTLHILHDGLADALKRILGDVRRRCGTRPSRRHKLPAQTLSHIDEAGNGNVDTRELFNHRLPAHESRKRFTPIEGRPIGQAGCESIGLVLITSDQNACHGSFWRLKKRLKNSRGCCFK